MPESISLEERMNALSEVVKGLGSDPKHSILAEATQLYKRILKQDKLSAEDKEMMNKYSNLTKTIKLAFEQLKAEKQTTSTPSPTEGSNRNYDQEKYQEMKKEGAPIDYIDILDKVYIDLSGNVGTVMGFYESFSTLSEMRRRITKQRMKIRQLELEASVENGLKMTPKKWEDEDQKVKELVDDYKWHLNQMAIEQEEELDIIYAQSRESYPSMSTDKDKNLLPKEKVARQLLVDDLPNNNTAKFLINHFTRDEFVEFQTKMKIRNRNNQKTALPIALKGTKEVSKNELLNGIVQKVKLWKNLFSSHLSYDIWPKGITRVEFSVEEINWIESILNPPATAKEDESERFSVEELEDIASKVEYRITILVDAISWINTRSILHDLFPDQLSVAEKVHTPSQMYKWHKLNYAETGDNKRKTDELLNRVFEKLDRPEYSGMKMFLLQPEICDKLTAEEKLTIIHSRLKMPVESCRSLFKYESLKRFDQKLKSFETRLRREKTSARESSLSDKPTKSHKPSIWLPNSPRDLEHRDWEDNIILELFFQMMLYKCYQFDIPAGRSQFNRDFQFVFENRGLMLRFRYKMFDAETGCFDHDNAAKFYKNYIESNDPNDVLRNWMSYEENILKKVEYTKNKRAEFSRLEALMKEDKLQNYASMGQKDQHRPPSVAESDEILNFKVLESASQVVPKSQKALASIRKHTECTSKESMIIN